MKHRVLIDAVSLLSYATGVGRYTYNISNELLKNSDLDIDFFYGFTSKELKSIKKSKSKKAYTILQKFGFVKKVLREVINYTAFKSYDLYWQPNFIPRNRVKSKKIITSIHDFAFDKYKEFHPKERVEYFEKNFFTNIYKSDFIICFSEFTKDEIMKFTDFKSNQIKVIYHGVNHNLFKQLGDCSLSFDLPKKFILSVGSIEPRKNLLRLLKAYNRLEASDYKLVLVGFSGWKNKEIMEQIDKNSQNILYLGYISDEELVKVYNRAFLFVYPSLYEGFGLPILEAMACGVPVVTSSVSSMPEVGGSAAIYCNPYDVEEIKAKIEFVLTDKVLQQKMIAEGMQRAKEFTWEKSANEHFKLFREVLES